MLGYTTKELIGKESTAIFYDLNEVVQISRDFSQDMNKNISPGFTTFVHHSGLSLKKISSGPIYIKIAKDSCQIVYKVRKI